MREPVEEGAKRRKGGEEEEREERKVAGSRSVCSEELKLDVGLLSLTEKEEAEMRMEEKAQAAGRLEALCWELEKQVRKL